jgi:predicted MFS family arabinose efflux permease
VSDVAVHGSPAQVRAAIAATRSLFAALGVVGGTWGVHISTLKNHYGLSEAALSMVLVATAIGALASLSVAGRAIGRYGPRNTAALCSVGLAGTLLLALHWPGLGWLLAAMVVFGAAQSVYDVAINTEGSALEVASGRPIMGSLHGSFSVGAMAGAGLASAMLHAGLSSAWQLAGAGALVAVWIGMASRWMLPTERTHDGGPAKVHFAWPRGALLIMGLLIFLGMSSEGVMYDWSVLYLRQEVHMSHALAAAGYAAFAGSMAVMRFAADALRARYSERRLLRASGGVAALAMAVVLLSGNPWVSLVGYAFIGAGLAMVVPILYGAAGRVPGTTPAAAIAAVSSIGYAGFLVGPPIIGGIAQQVSLTWAMGIVVLAAGVLAFSAHHVPEKRS